MRLKHGPTVGKLPAIKEVEQDIGVQIVGSVKETVAAALSGLALSHTIAKAMWLGLFTDGRPFLRTPKMEQSVALRSVLHLRKH